MKTAVVLTAAALAVGLGAAASQAQPLARIVFAADRAPTVTGEIYILHPNGHRVDLSKSPYQDTDPLVSSDGKQVAFLSDRSGTTSLYDVGIDGHGLVRLGPPVALNEGPAAAWQPGGSRIALVGSTGSGGEASLWLLQRGTSAQRIFRSSPSLGTSGMFGPIWSQDGHVLLAWANNTYYAFNPFGKRIWTVTGAGIATSSSPQGLIAIELRSGYTPTGFTVYDEHGHVRFRVSGNVTAGPIWSPDGKRIAAVIGRGEVRVYDATGKLVLLKHSAASTHVFPPPFSWGGSDRLVFGYTGRCTCHTTALDVRTGQISPASSRWLDPLSPDRKLAIVTPPAAVRMPFTVGVAPPAGGAVKKYEEIGGCFGDGDWMPAARSLQFVGQSRSIVYESWGECDEPFSNLYSVAPDGSGVKRLTHVQAQETQPALSPDGSEIAYVWADATGLSCKGCSDGIRIASADGAGVRTLTDPEECNYDDLPTWSPDGSTILYEESGCSNPGELYAIPATGGTPHDLGIAGGEPAWGPSRIAYEADGGGVWTANSDGSDPEEVSTKGELPAWSADGRLAFLEGTYGTTLVVGATKAKLPFAWVNSLAWSRDGSSLIVAASKTLPGSLDLYTVRTDGTHLVRLTKNYGVFGTGGP